MRFSMKAIAPLQTAAFSFAAPKAIVFLFFNLFRGSRSCVAEQMNYLPSEQG
ncbi:MULTISPECIES: hypothetical protein [unclassified Moorena]|uniref:hypothetical protein n=1 Tax=unclassified Moorena TaxID=2683338 RepID=UPI0013FFC581|nr:MULTISPECIES: hypothetical protein [unclassified Moorena]NEO16047.1 hypothetical protein [Moorena sp. SIO3E8]NEP98234.1 hypothetical protein [Moorena sp. SIO3F7]